MSSPETLSEAHFTNLLQRLRRAGVTTELHHMPGCGVLVVPGRRHVAISLEPPLHERYRMLCEAARRLHLTDLIADDPFAEALVDTLDVATRPVSAAGRPLGPHVPHDDDSLEISIDVSLDQLKSSAGRPANAGIPLSPPPQLRGVSGRATRPVYVGAPDTSQRGDLADALIDDVCGDTLRDDTRQISRQSLARHLADVAAAADAKQRPDSDTASQRPTVKQTVELCELCARPRYASVRDVVLCRQHLYGLTQGRLLPDEVKLLRRRHRQHPELAATFYDEDGEPSY